MTQFLQLAAGCRIQPYWPDLAHLIAGRPLGDGPGLASSGVGLRVVAALVAVPLATALPGSVVLLSGGTAA